MATLPPVNQPNEATKVVDTKANESLLSIKDSLSKLVSMEIKNQKNMLEASRESSGSAKSGSIVAGTVDPETKKQGGLIGSILKVLGTGALISTLSGLGKAVATLGIGFAAGMTSLGAGISGFLIGFYGGENILKAITDSNSGETMIALLGNVGKAFDALGTTALVSIGLAGAMGAMLASQKGNDTLKGSVKGALGMGMGITAFGAGLSGFMIAFYSGENILKYITDSESGGIMVPLFANVGKAFDALGTTGLVSIGLAGAMGAKMANQNGDQSLKGTVKGALGMTSGIAAFGAGLAGFMIAFYSGENILKYITDSKSGEIMVPLFANVGKAFDALGTTALVSIGLAGAMGAKMANQKGDKSLFGTVKGGIGMATGIAAFGAGLAGFMLAMAGTDAILKIISDEKIGSSFPKLFKNISDAFESLNDKVLVTMAVAGGIGTAFGIQKAAGGALGLTLFGAGIAGFIAAFDGIAKISAVLGVDGSSIKTLMTNVAEGLNAFDPDSLKALGIALAGSALISSKEGVKHAGETALGLTAFGLGIGGFLSGLAVAGGLAAWLGTDGSGISAIMKNVAEGLNAFDSDSLIALGTVLTGSTLFSAVGGITIAGKAAVGLGLFGLGIGGFLAGLSIVAGIAGWMGVTGESLVPILTNVGKAIGGFLGGLAGERAKQLENLDGEKLKSVAIGLGELAGGMSAFALSGLTATMAEILQSTLTFITGKDGIDVEKLNKLAEIDGLKLKDVGIGLGEMGEGLKLFHTGLGEASIWTEVKSFFTTNPFEFIAKNLETIKDSDIERMERLGKSMNMIAEGISSLAESRAKAADISTTFKELFTGDYIENMLAPIRNLTPEDLSKLQTVSGAASQFVVVNNYNNVDNSSKVVSSSNRNVSNSNLLAAFAQGQM